MNRLLASLLVASLAVNGWLGWKWAATPAAADPSHPNESPAFTPPAGKNLPLPVSDFLPTPGLRQSLLAAGMPPAVVRATLLAALREKYRAELAATASANPSSTAWWKQARPSTPEDQARRQAREEINHRIATELAALLGEPPPRRWDDSRYHFLSEDKERLVRSIEADYQSLLQRNQALHLSDPAKDAFVRQEMERDIAQALTPAEYAEFQLRFAAVSMGIRQRLGYIDGTEEEFRSLHDIEKQLRAKLGAAARFNFDAAGDELRRGYMRTVEERLGPKRALDYLWGTEAEYRMLQDAARKYQRQELAHDVVRWRTDIGERARDIASQENWSSEQKLAALRELAQDAREKLGSLVTPEVHAELPDKFFGWIDELEAGRLRLYTPLTSGFGTQTIVPMTPPATPPRG